MDATVRLVYFVRRGTVTRAYLVRRGIMNSNKPGARYAVKINFTETAMGAAGHNYDAEAIATKGCRG